MHLGRGRNSRLGVVRAGHILAFNSGGICRAPGSCTGRPCVKRCLQLAFCQPPS
ncbi:uncharacterized protein B0I36DRAFT_327440 [Microdochium trichocladiopsis]|uniref:Uncharacterized protein n=1 Tax=Microdochium trichocladiopsis TaxID=1682393 RepID=A0A9P8Y454_9PEZI|nr:uncharacterized protein B0I36DRAFT_327440 [Microdochium trichocladiopsis]KAH7027597.1 hypothetical protein B0I36DRAFT_327440 [Microdochium trichocladiopsis]